MRRVAVLIMVGLLGGGCSGSARTVPSADSTGSSPTATSGAPATSSFPDAAKIVAGLKAAISSIADTHAYTADDDPNHLLGRPGQYTSKAGFQDSRVAAKDVLSNDPFDIGRGGGVEVFPDSTGAKQRADYIGALANQPGASALFGGPEYLYLRGKVLLRVSGQLSPANAAEYEKALAAIVG